MSTEIEDDEKLCYKIKEVLIKGLRLKTSPENIKNNAPLFGKGLGLDSMDAIELVIILERNFSVKIPDTTMAEEIFSSINSIAAYVKANQP